ncbi:hypothetical protein [Sphingomonas sp. LT1P40]|uniref:hypothetical protein n=1 Tax=Alteristakelama amylovorans TaxID=3096166 RepID=UPI002FCC0993
MLPAFKNALVMSVVLLNVACGAALTSTDVRSSSATSRQALTGQAYYLPRGLIEVRLVASAANGLQVELSEPVFVADTGAEMIESAQFVTQGCVSSKQWGPYVLTHKISGFHEDTMKVEQTNSLLTSIDSDTKEKTTEALGNLAKSAAALRPESGAKDTTDAVLLRIWVDPADCPQMAAANDLLKTTVRTRGIEQLRQYQADAAKDSFIKKLDLNRQLQPFTIGLRGYRPFTWPSGVRARATDCRRGICTRQPTPAFLEIVAGGARLQSAVIQLTNGADPVVIPVSRSGLADVSTKVTLVSGVATKTEVTRKSEAAALFLLPATLVGAYLDQSTSFLTKRKSRIDQIIALEKARADLADKAKVKAEAGLKGADALLSVGYPGLSRIKQGIGGDATEVTVNPGQPAGKATVQPSPADKARESEGSDGDAAGNETAK